jgi:hypothetical protein
MMAKVQGDQIGQIFTYWAIIFLGRFIEKYRSGANYWATFFPHHQLRINFDKNVWATRWATFTQTHLVTLAKANASILMSWHCFQPPIRVQ